MIPDYIEEPTRIASLEGNVGRKVARCLAKTFPVETGEFVREFFCVDVTTDKDFDGVFKKAMTNAKEIAEFELEPEYATITVDHMSTGTIRVTIRPTLIPTGVKDRQGFLHKFGNAIYQIWMRVGRLDQYNLRGMLNSMRETQDMVVG